MVAGALVNERDIGQGLFTPDVAYPSRPLTPDQYVFFSGLPQALSTRAEMMERYDTPARDGVTTCIERVHVTGGTNGILVDALRRHRPFTPSFVGRAEDQAYLLSVLGRPGDGGADGPMPRLAYAHAAGLIMRHDKEAFAGEAIAAAEAGKLVGDDVRILQFSAYAAAIAAAATGSAPGDAPDVGAGQGDPRPVHRQLRLPPAGHRRASSLRAPRRAGLRGRPCSSGRRDGRDRRPAHRRGIDLHAERWVASCRRTRARCLERLLRRPRRSRRGDRGR